MKILFVEYMACEQYYNMSTLYSQKCKKIIDDERFTFYDLDKEIDFIPQEFTHLLLGARTLFFYKNYKGVLSEMIKNKIEQLLCIPNKYIWLQDTHNKTYKNINYLYEFVKNNNVNVIFTFFNNTESKYIRKYTPNVKHYHLPHHIDTSIFNYKNMEKKYDILLYGSIHKTHYPFRFRLFELLPKHFNVYIIDKPEEFNPDFCEHGLANLINQSKLVVATKSKYDYFVAKYLEICACKAFVIGDMAKDGVEIFKENYLDLGNLSDENIIEKVQECLNNYNLLENKINYMYEKVHNEYNLDKYVDKLYNIMDC